MHYSFHPIIVEVVIVVGGGVGVLWRYEETGNIGLISQGGFLHILVSLGCFASFRISISCPAHLSVFILLLHVGSSFLYVVFHTPPFPLSSDPLSVL